MFKSLKEKLKSWFKKTTEEIKNEEKEKAEHKVDKILIEPIDKIPEIELPPEKEKLIEKLAPEEVQPEEKTEEKAGKKGLLAKVKDKFIKTEINESHFGRLFPELEEILLENNVAFNVVSSVKEMLKEKIMGKSVKTNEISSFIKEQLKEVVSEILVEPFDILKRAKENKPYIILFFGINGSGKTTTIAKLAKLFLNNKLSVVLAASDTFRAASIEQLAQHAQKLGVAIIKHDYGADPAAVAFDAIKHAKSHNKDIVLIDTAGRMHTKENLIREMEKIVRVTKPDLKIFVGESITGSDLLEQLKIFHSGVGIDAVILTKADVDEKGGTALSVGHITGKPILFLGIGQKYTDLEPFTKKKILESLGLD
ncbi:signal recognition particle-docking protein FtsY [Candidatus Pacearchaeota archaeon]|nr:signal recognition particle-docking protein FtsY [Candidatus Pacearchaeota archaeon]